MFPCEVGALLRNRSGAVYSRFTLPDDFREVTNTIFPGDLRTLADMRRSGAIELLAGGAEAGTVSAKMANTIETSNALQQTYQPVSLAAVRSADRARLVGRAEGCETARNKFQLSPYVHRLMRCRKLELLLIWLGPLRPSKPMVAGSSMPGSPTSFCS